MFFFGKKNIIECDVLAWNRHQYYTIPVTIWAVTCDFQQCWILTSVDLDKPVHHPFKLRNSKWSLVSSLTVINIQTTSKGSDQSARMRRLVWAFAGRTYTIVVGNLMSRLICQIGYIYMTALSSNLISRTAILLTWYLHSFKT